MRTTAGAWIHRRKLAAMRRDTVRRARLARECQQVMQRVVQAVQATHRRAGSPVATVAVLRARQA